MASGKVASVDEDKVLAECQRRGLAIAKESGLDTLTRSHWPQC
jgi:hypothetical protein